MRVLVIEDDPEFRTFLQVFLDGHADVDAVSATATAAEGLRSAADEKPDVVVVDFDLGEIKGDQVARQIKALCPTTRVVGFSGSTEDLSWADRVIPKGGRVNLDDLMDAIRPK